MVSRNTDWRALRIVVEITVVLLFGRANKNEVRYE